MCVARSVAKTAAASVAATTAPSSTRLEPGEVEEPVRGDAGEQRADDDADRAQERRRHRDLAQAPPRGLQPALVEDQREPDHPDLCGRAPRRRTRSRRARPSRAASRARGRRRAPAARSWPLRARGRCSPTRIAPTSRSTRPSSTLSIFARWESAAAAWNTSGMATRPRTRKIGRLSEIAQVAVRHGFGYFFERHKLTDILPWTVARRGRSRRVRGRVGARPPPARDARRARADVRQVRPAAVDPARRRAAGHRRRAPRPPGRRPSVSRSRRSAR